MTEVARAARSYSSLHVSIEPKRNQIDFSSIRNRIEMLWRVTKLYAV